VGVRGGLGGFRGFVFTPPVPEGNLAAFCARRVVSFLCPSADDFVPNRLVGVEPREDMMKSKSKILVAFFLGVITAKVGFDLAGWSYNPYQDGFVFWKAALKYGAPIAAALAWLWIFQVAFKLRSKW
jgi:hypothetical protein